MRNLSLYKSVCHTLKSKSIKLYFKISSSPLPAQPNFSSCCSPLLQQQRSSPAPFHPNSSVILSAPLQIPHCFSKRRRCLTTATMAAPLQKRVHSGTSSGGSYEVTSAPEFPVGLRVLVVDDDTTTLKIIEKMSISCNYRG